MRFLFWFFIFVVAVGVIGVITCPDKEKHVDKLSSVVVEAVGDETRKWGVPDDVTDRLVDEANSSGVIENAVDEVLTVESYGAFSLGKVKFRNEEYVVSLGIFGMVFTMTSEMLAEKVEVLLEKRFN